MKGFAKGVFWVLSFVCGVIITPNSASYGHFKAIGVNQALNITDSGRIRRNYGYDTNNYGNYHESHDGYNNNNHNNNYGKKYACCHCDSGGSGSLLFFGLGSLLGLLFAMPMMMTGNATPAPAPAPGPAPAPAPAPAPGTFRSERNDLRFQNLERSKRSHSFVIPMKRKEIGRETIQSVLTKVLGKPECIKHWFCELYQHVNSVLSKNEMKMLKFLIESVEKIEESKSCKNLLSNYYCNKLID